MIIIRARSIGLCVSIHLATPAVNQTFPAYLAQASTRTAIYFLSNEMQKNCLTFFLFGFDSRRCDLSKHTRTRTHGEHSVISVKRVRHLARFSRQLVHPMMRDWFFNNQKTCAYTTVSINNKRKQLLEALEYSNSLPLPRWLHHALQTFSTQSAQHCII